MAPEMTWYLSSSVTVATSRTLTPARLKASSVGAKTVKGPAPLSAASTPLYSRIVRTDTRVDSIGVATAVSTMVEADTIDTKSPSIKDCKAFITTCTEGEYPMLVYKNSIAQISLLVM
jgi:hypothetical protein